MILRVIMTLSVTIQQETIIITDFPACNCDHDHDHDDAHLRSFAILSFRSLSIASKRHFKDPPRTWIGVALETAARFGRNPRMLRSAELCSHQAAHDAFEW